MDIRFVEDTFAKNAQGITKIYHEVLLLMKLLPTKPQVKHVIIKYCNLFYTVFKSREEKEVIDNQYEDDFISLNDDIIPNHYVGLKN